jgi:hypothetical protein
VIRAGSKIEACDQVEQALIGAIRDRDRQGLLVKSFDIAADEVSQQPAQGRRSYRLIQSAKASLHLVMQQDLYRNAMTWIRLRRRRTVLEGSALADGLGAGLEPVEDLQGALVSGGYNSGRRSIKSRPEMFVGFRHATPFQQ